MNDEVPCYDIEYFADDDEMGLCTVRRKRGYCNGLNKYQTYENGDCDTHKKAAENSKKASAGLGQLLLTEAREK